MFTKFEKRTRILAGLIVLIAVLSLAACAPAKPKEDPNLVYTQAAETVSAQLTLTQAAQPPATQTPEPSATPLPPTATVELVVPTLTPLALQQTNTPAPTATQIRVGGDGATWAYNSPPDGKVFTPGENFQLAFGLLNTGSTSWTQEYKLIWSGGTQVSSTTSVSHDPDGGKKLTVPPGEKGEFIVAATAPQKPGSYKTTWFFKSPSGAFIYEVYFPFKVE